MRDIELFQIALGLASPWRVVGCDFDACLGRLEIRVGFARGSRFACPGCGAADCAVHDVAEKRWRHLNFFEHRTELCAQVPRVRCAACGVRQVVAPWARPGSGFTLLFEAYVLALAKAMPVAEAAALVGEHDTRLWRILDHYVTAAVDALDLSRVERVAIDETSARRGHDYVTLFADMTRRRVVHVADGKDAAAIGAFVDFLESHGGDRRAVSDVAIDMSAAFIAGVATHLPAARITFDKFHVVKLINKAVDEVRRQEARHTDWLKGTRYLWLKNTENLTDAEKAGIVALEAANLDTMQAWQMRQNFQDIFKSASPAAARRFLKRWHAWVTTCDLQPMRKAAATIMAKADDILRAIASGMSNGLLEAINANVQAAKRKAKGYKTKRNLKLIIYLVAGAVLDAPPT